MLSTLKRFLHPNTPKEAYNPYIDPKWEESFDVDLSKHQGELVFTRDHRTGGDCDWLIYLGDQLDIPGLRYLEIGCQEGHNVLWLLKNKLQGQASTITCIDTFKAPGMERNFDHNISVSGFDSKVEKYRGKSQDVLRTLEPASYDFIFVDGLHTASAVLEDAVLCWRLLKQEAILVFDDYLWRQDEVKAGIRDATQCPKIAIDAFVQVFDGQLEVLSKANSQVVLVKTKDTQALEVYNL